jgi:hypothetical protein
MLNGILFTHLPCPARVKLGERRYSWECSHPANRAWDIVKCLAAFLG